MVDVFVIILIVVLAGLFVAFDVFIMIYFIHKDDSK